MDPMMNRAAPAGGIASVAKALGDLAGRVVFVGGAVAPLLHTGSVLPPPRTTRDVDGVVASPAFGDYDEVARTIGAQGFSPMTDARDHVHRWRSPDGIVFDIVPAGDHLGGSGSRWDVLALEAPVVAVIDGVTLRHVTAAIFIAMKLDAYKDRGRGDLAASHDIEDIIVLIASRPSIVDDVRGAAAAVQAKVTAFAAALVTSEIADDILTGHLNDADNVGYAVRVAKERLGEIAAIAR